MNVSLSNALSGLSASTRRLDASAARVVAAPTAPPPGVDLAAEAVQQIASGITYKANAKVVRAADEMLKGVLDMKA